MIQSLLKFNRVFALAGTLFLFSGCASRVKPWKFVDVYAVDVQILNIRQWSILTKKDLANLDPIMKKELRYYLDNDLRIYKRLEPNYEMMELSLFAVDSLTKELYRLVRRMKKNRLGGIDSIPSDTNITYRKMMGSISIGIQNSQKQYKKGKLKLNKGFKKVQKRIVYVIEDAAPLKKDLYALKYKRDHLEPHIKYFDKKLNESLFQNDKSIFSDHIMELSKKLESYNVRLDKFEKYIIDIEKIAQKEAGSTVMLTGKKPKAMDYKIRFEKQKKSYLEILKEIRKITALI